MAETERLESDRLDGTPHPREARAVFGQDHAEAAFLEAYRSGRLHSGWLLTGPRGIGKATLAYRIAAFLLAERADGFVNGTSRASLALPEDHPDLRLIRAGAHPRLAVVRRGLNDRGDRLSAEIRAAEVRKLKEFFQLSAPDGGRRVVVVDAADEMNVTAANALLKELEEPPAGATLLLVAHQPSRLLPTVRSRCRTLRLAPLGGVDLGRALESLGHAAEAPDALALLAAGSVGAAVTLQAAGGLQRYSDLVELLAGLPRIDRPAAIRLAESAAGRGAETRFALLLDLVDIFLARAARAGLSGAPDVQAAPGEARLLARLAPDVRAARDWADLQVRLSRRARAGRAVNIDPAVLLLDMVFAIEETARRTIPA